jgi:hypothetical protein
VLFYQPSNNPDGAYVKNLSGRPKDIGNGGAQDLDAKVCFPDSLKVNSQGQILFNQISSDLGMLYTGATSYSSNYIKEFVNKWNGALGDAFQVNPMTNSWQIGDFTNFNIVAISSTIFSVSVRGCAVKKINGTTGLNGTYYNWTTLSNAINKASSYTKKLATLDKELLQPKSPLTKNGVLYQAFLSVIDKDSDSDLTNLAVALNHLQFDIPLLSSQCSGATPGFGMRATHMFGAATRAYQNYKKLTTTGVKSKLGINSSYELCNLQFDLLLSCSPGCDGNTCSNLSSGVSILESFTDQGEEISGALWLAFQQNNKCPCGGTKPPPKTYTINIPLNENEDIPKTDETSKRLRQFLSFGKLIEELEQLREQIGSVEIAALVTNIELFFGQIKIRGEDGVDNPLVLTGGAVSGTARGESDDTIPEKPSYIFNEPLKSAGDVNVNEIANAAWKWNIDTITGETEVRVNNWSTVVVLPGGNLRFKDSVISLNVISPLPVIPFTGNVVDLF